MMRCLSAVLAVVLTLQAATFSFGQVEAVTQSRYDLDLGFTLGGKVLKMLVEPGQKVQKGQVLAELEDEEGAAMLERVKIRAGNDVSIRAAIAKRDLSAVEVERLTQLVAKEAASEIELRRAKAQLEVDELSIENAKLEYQEAQVLVVQHTARHAQYTLKAPMDGVVSKVVTAEGELVEQLKPIIRMVVIDPLWIDVAVPTNLTLNLKAGDPALVNFSLPGEGKALEAKVKYVDVIADAGSDTRLVRVELPNPRGLPPGTHVSVSFPTSAGATADATKRDAVESAK
jgi:RND family efflux transporter MFP subunit